MILKIDSAHDRIISESTCTYEREETIMNISEIIELSQSVEIESETVATDGYTPYQVWKIVVETMEVMSLPTSKITSQMMYNYAKNGSIDGQKYESTKGVRFSEDTVKYFVAKFVAKQAKKQ